MARAPSLGDYDVIASTRTLPVFDADFNAYNATVISVGMNGRDANAVSVADGTMLWRYTFDDVPRAAAGGLVVAEQEDRITFFAPTR